MPLIWKFCPQEARNSSKIRPLDFEKKMEAQPRKTFRRMLMDTRATSSSISVMSLC